MNIIPSPTTRGLTPKIEPYVECSTACIDVGDIVPPMLPPVVAPLPEITHSAPAKPAIKLFCAHNQTIDPRLGALRSKAKASVARV